MLMCDVIYQTVNLFSSDKCFTYFISDVSTTPMKSAQHRTILIKVDVLDTCGVIIWSYFGIAFLLIFMKIENTVFTSFQNSTLLQWIDFWHHEHSKQPFSWIWMNTNLASLRSVNGWRFSWLCNVFQDWLNSVQQCQGNFTKHADQKMFISWQTYEGLKKKALIKSLKHPNFLFDIRVGIYWQNAFAKILSKTGLVGKDL